MAASCKMEQEWEEYFSRENVTFFQKLLMLHRRVFISRAAERLFERTFPSTGIYLEAGSGTSESSGRIQRKHRQLVALDICHFVLDKHNILEHKIQGDIFSLPLKENSVDGIWNFGVMEHFSDDELVRILGEFYRVLKPGCAALLLWPPWYAPHELGLNSIAWILRTFLRKEVRFFPDEVNRFRTRKRVKTFLDPAGLCLEKATWTWHDLYSYVNVVARKPVKA